eukprot:gb/GEZN01015381.1/.p1 GENE.gb/GEZN01015381.1/~~gb/GEZN01015381.1/.p1  ORF type:complete len:198 (-),score=36.21 gb/GEZN01015381.1/:266-859(-)
MLAWLRSLLTSILQSLGFLDQKATLVLLGLDNAGKTTLQYKLKTGKIITFAPTQRAKAENLTLGGLSISAWDLGGHKAARHLWKNYSAMADGVIFMLDGADTERLPEAKQELDALVSLPEVVGLPILVLANKSDLKEALGRAALLEGLGINSKAAVNLELFQISVYQGTGFEAGFQWLAKQINQTSERKQILQTQAD